MKSQTEELFALFFFEKKWMRTVDRKIDLDSA
jgi:hypothetical protein